jgi:hypothetical protein
MPLLGNSKQNKDKSLEDFYHDLKKDKSNPVWEKIGTDMLAFIEMINETFEQTEIWGLTSHSRLVLQTIDKWDAEWFVIVNCIGSNEYYFEYLMTDDKKPWDYATVKGVTQTLTDAKKYLLIAMKESGGWTDNEELKKLLLDYNIS